MPIPTELEFWTARALGAAIVVGSIVTLAGCNDAPKATAHDAGLGASADAGASKRASEKKLNIEAQVADMVTKKGLTVRSVSCPDDAADHYTVKCPVVTGQADNLVAECRGDSDHPDCKLNAAVVDAAKVVGQIRGELAKKKKPKAEVNCPDGPIVKAVGERFYCKATTKKKTIPVDVTVMDLEGRVRLAFKS